MQHININMSFIDNIEKDNRIYILQHNWDISDFYKKIAHLQC